MPTDTTPRVAVIALSVRSVSPQLPVSCRNAHFHSDTCFSVPDVFALVLWSRALRWSVSASCQLWTSRSPDGTAGGSTPMQTVVRLTPSLKGPRSGLILFFRFFQHVPWWAAPTRCAFKPPSKATRTFHSPGELTLTTALRPSSDCKLCTPSSDTQSPPLLLVASTTTHLRSVRIRPLCSTTC